MGLKLRLLPDGGVEGGGLNRTSVGLKPQIARRRIARIAHRLNRTSVGLKLEVEAAREGVGPQSNQRGIETFASRAAHRLGRLTSIEPAWD